MLNLNIFIDFQPEDLVRPTTSTTVTVGDTRPDPRVGSGRKFDLQVRVGSGNNLLATGRVG